MKRTVKLDREPFLPFVTLTVDNGSTEELEAEEARAWFRARGADMDQVEKCLDHVWNFYHAVFVINDYHDPVVLGHEQPKI